jgi:superfamily II DNA or RNA helicase
MSICATINEITEELEEKIINEVFVKKIEKTINPLYKAKDIIVRPYRIENEKLYIPFQWALQNIPGIKRKTKDKCQSMNENVKFTAELRETQKSIKSECINALNNYGSHLLSLHVGGGKTVIGIYLACKIGLKTLIICNRVGLMEQWIEEIQSFTCNATSQILKPKNFKNNEGDFILVNAENMKKFDESVFDNIGFCIVDECHSIMAEKLSECLYHVNPRYLLGLSATPYRPDGLDGLLDFYFGQDNKTVRELYHPHIVYKINTSIEFEEDSKQWNTLLTSQCNNEVRNTFIINLTLHLKEKCILILCKRVDQALYIFDKLDQMGEEISLLTGDNNEYSKNSRIIVASVQKVGMGFSYKKLDTLILASDVISGDTEEYFVQYIGRIMRREDVKPIIFDIVDDHPVLKRHFSVRKRVYLKTGGVIKDFYKEPEFSHFQKF